MPRTSLRATGLGLLLSLGATLTQAAGPEDTLLLELKDGTVVIEMLPQLAPRHVARIKELARQGYYDGKKWHRVIDGFMAQTGSPTGDGRGGTGHPLAAEFSREKHVRGIASMARTSDPDSADAQFFIMLAPAPHLDGQLHRVGPRRQRHGVRRQHQEGRARQQRHGRRSRPHRFDEGAGGPAVTAGRGGRARPRRSGRELRPAGRPARPLKARTVRSAAVSDKEPKRFRFMRNRSSQ